MATTNNGGPAFPVVASNGLGHVTDGMDLRDYFAAKAMQAMLCVDTDNGRFRDVGKRTAELAYRVADAMIKARG